MVKNFFVITKSETNIIYKLDIDDTLQSQLSDLFENQHKVFNESYPLTDEIDFTKNWNATLNKDQSFIIEKFEDMEGIYKSITEPQSYDSFDLNETEIKGIKGIYTGIDNGNEIAIWIQCFNSSRIITRKKLALFTSKTTFNKMEEEIIVLDSKLAGTFIINKSDKNIGKLKFHSFHEIRQLFDMSEYYKLASEEQIKIFLDNGLFDSKEVDFDNVNKDFFKRKIGVILQDKLLEHCSVESILSTARKRNIELEKTDSNRIKLPKDKVEFKAFVRLLSEDFYDGDFSKNSYSANSKIKVTK
jgi:hypothetical protein